MTVPIGRKHCHVPEDQGNVAGCPVGSLSRDAAFLICLQKSQVEFRCVDMPECDRSPCLCSPSWHSVNVN